MRTLACPFRWFAAAVVAVLLLGAGLPQPGRAQDADPPTRVGRLASLGGTVSLHTKNDSQWRPATLNYPVIQGYALSTEPNGQAAIEISASRFVMAPGTELDITTLTETASQVAVPRGELYLHIRAATQSETYAVRTPRGVVALAAPGRYGVAVGDIQSPMLVTVIDGSARVEGPGVSLDVQAGQTASITGSDTLHAELGPSQRDGFLTAMLDDERPAQPQAVAAPPVVAAMPGGEDLTRYGSWIESPQYGEVWYPQVAPDWVPYRQGSWVYVEPWGWTWVDSAPWGFAPFHYGRWVEIAGRWGWIPGGAAGPPYPVYAPALVTFFGGGAAIGLGVGAALAEGRIGWCPLGPRETYRPWYRASGRYLRQVNMGHIGDFAALNRNVTIDTLVNHRAATVVPTEAMTGSHPVASSFQRWDPAQLGQSRILVGQPPPRPASINTGLTPAVSRPVNLPPAPGTVVPPAGNAPGARVGQPPWYNPARPVTPAIVTHLPPQVHPPPVATFQQTVPQGGSHATPPPPPMVHVPPPPTVVHAPQPIVHAAPPPAVPQFHAAPPHPVAPPPPPSQNTRHKRPGEP